MPRWLRWIGRALAALVLLIVIVVAAVYAISTRHIRQTYEFPESSVRAAADSVSLARGRHLVEAIGKCQECHGADMGGELWVDEPAGQAPRRERDRPGEHALAPERPDDRRGGAGGVDVHEIAAGGEGAVGGTAGRRNGGTA